MWGGTAPEVPKNKNIPVKFKSVPIENGKVKSKLVLQVGNNKEYPVSEKATRWKKVINMLEGQSKLIERQWKLMRKNKKSTTTIKQEMREQSKKIKGMRKQLMKVIQRQKALEC
tara:strand:+ start:961 stop:1302 length:342 start_codon:yes stop_codon:yes gene_type:complete